MILTLDILLRKYQKVIKVQFNYHLDDNSNIFSRSALNVNTNHINANYHELIDIFNQEYKEVPKISKVFLNYLDKPKQSNLKKNKMNKGFDSDIFKSALYPSGTPLSNSNYKKFSQNLGINKNSNPVKDSQVSEISHIEKKKEILNNIIKDIKQNKNMHHTVESTKTLEPEAKKLIKKEEKKIEERIKKVIPVKKEQVSKPVKPTKPVEPVKPKAPVSTLAALANQAQDNSLADDFDI